jgi:hypothetical protein
MSFHVEISSSFHRARVFNLGEDELRQTVLEPWVGDQPFELGEQEWEPRESKLMILEGPTLGTPDLSFGQGWSNAQRSAEDVTRRMLEGAESSASGPSAAMVEADSLDGAIAELSAGRDLQPIRWSAARERIDGRDPAVAAVILVVRRPEPGSQRS